MQGITGGCAGGNFCPTSPVNRQQMAVFLLKAFEGSGYTPPACTVATFTDVPCSHQFATWIYELVARNITAGCGGGNYCPGTSANRGQIATFITKTLAFSDHLAAGTIPCLLRGMPRELAGSAARLGNRSEARARSPAPG